ncbi:MAG: amino acid ABC transporter ATP-binding protein [Bacteroidales bacterium]|nr:amino acid ABC transporter ATP-binding protein [Bacteroidales bacterium]
MIKVSHLTKSYIDPDGSIFRVLKDINCEIEQGEVISIIGPSGTGKSTFLRSINLLDPPTSGSIYIDGENILAKGYPVHKMRQKVGMVFQNFNLFDHMTVLENVMYAPCKIKKEPLEQARKSGLSLLRKVGLAEKADVYPSTLSGGQKQRVAIARCLAMKPEVILFDEPTSALDPTMVGEVLSVIRKLAKEGMTMLIVTHEMKFARDVSTRIFFMNEGIIYEDGPAKQVFENPRHSATKAFVQRIRKEVFEIDSLDFDFLDMSTRIQQFCIKYDIPEVSKMIQKLCQLLMPYLLAEDKPLTIRVTHSELSDETTLDFMVEGLDHSPLLEPDITSELREDLQSLCKGITEEPTSRGFRLKLSL